MKIEPADLTDIDQCQQLEMSYTTDYVWQLQTQERPRTITLRFDTVRLPRAMQVAYPRTRAELLDHWEQAGCFLVAYQDDELIGFIDAQAHAWQHRLTVLNLVVDTPYRHQGVGTALLKKAMAWAKTENLHQIMLEVQTKNHPAISFAQKHGFQFCGYNELYYRNGDITLYFARSL